MTQIISYYGHESCYCGGIEAIFYVAMNLNPVSALLYRRNCTGQCVLFHKFFSSFFHHMWVECTSSVVCVMVQFHLEGLRELWNVCEVFQSAYGVFRCSVTQHKRWAEQV